MPDSSSPPPEDPRSYAGPERRTARRHPGPNEIIAYARFRDLPGIHERYPGHDPGRWYEVRDLNHESVDPVSPPGYVWLDMGIIRGVWREDLEIRHAPP